MSMVVRYVNDSLMKESKKGTPKQLVFLTYLNRSGSTYLASKLAAYSDVGVGIEAKFFDGWNTPGFSVKNREELKVYLDRMYKDAKFCAWNVTRAELEAALLGNEFPLRFSDVLSEALRLYFSSGELQVYIHKCGDYYRCTGQIVEEIPEAKFIFIDRDPRAIYSSQRKSIDSQTGKPMQRNILHFIFGYLDTQRIVQSAHESNFMIVRYEDLVVSEKSTMATVEKFIGITRQKDSSHEDYFVSVPSSQKHLHSNVKKGGPQVKRISGWQEELPPADILLLQNVLRKHLAAQGATLYHPDVVSLRDRFRFLINLLLFRYEAAKRRVFHIEHRY